MMYIQILNAECSHKNCNNQKFKTPIICKLQQWTSKTKYIHTKPNVMEIHAAFKIPNGGSLLASSSPLYSSMPTLTPSLISSVGVLAISFASVTITNDIIHIAVIIHQYSILEIPPSSEDKIAMDTKHELRIVITPMFFYIS